MTGAPSSIVNFATCLVAIYAISISFVALRTVKIWKWPVYQAIVFYMHKNYCKILTQFGAISVPPQWWLLRRYWSDASQGQAPFFAVLPLTMRGSRTADRPHWRMVVFVGRFVPGFLAVVIGLVNTVVALGVRVVTGDIVAMINILDRQTEFFVGVGLYIIHTRMLNSTFLKSMYIQTRT